MTSTTAGRNLATKAKVAGLVGIGEELIIDCNTIPTFPEGVGVRNVERHYPQGRIPWSPVHFFLFRTREQRGVNDTPTTRGLRTVSTHRIMAAMNAKRQVGVNAGVYNFFKTDERRVLIPTDVGSVSTISFPGTLFEGACGRTVVAQFSLIKGIWTPDFRDLADDWGPGDAVLVFSRRALANLDIKIPA